MKTLPLFILIVLFLFSCIQPKHDGFVINGTTDLPDGSKVYLTEFTFLKERGDFDPKIIDSTTISDGQFSFKGKLPVDYAHMMIRGENPSEYKYIYVVNAEMIFDAKGTSLKDARISGSYIQDQANQYNATDNVFENKLDSIETLAMGTEEDDSLRGVYMTAYQDVETAQYAAVSNLIRSNPDYELSSYWLMFLQHDVSEETTKELYEGLSEKVKKNVYSEVVLNHIQKSIKLEVGLQAPEIVLADSTGKEITLSNYKGKYVLIDFWASSCGPCRLENINLAKVYNAYKSKGFEIFSVSVDLSESKWKQAMKKDGVLWTSVWDSKRKFDKLYDVSSLPTNYLVDPNGVIIDKYLRGSALPEKLEEIFKTSSSTNL